MPCLGVAFLNAQVSCSLPLQLFGLFEDPLMPCQVICSSLSFWLCLWGQALELTLVPAVLAVSVPQEGTEHSCSALLLSILCGLALSVLW